MEARAAIVSVLALACAGPQLSAPPRRAAPVPQHARPCTPEWSRPPIDLQFGINATELSDTPAQILEEAVHIAMRMRPARIRIEGHVDACGEHPIDPYALSTQRADFVSAAFLRAGVPRERIETLGRAAERPRLPPCAERSPLYCGNMDRRVEVTFLVCR